MDENFRGNSNPLNQNVKPAPNMGGAQAGQMGANGPMQQAPNPINRPMRQASNPMNRPMQQAPTSPMGMSNSDTPSGVPTRPMQQAPVSEPPVGNKKKKNMGLIIGIIAGVLILAGAGIAVALMLLNNGDPVSKAMEKIVANEAPEYVEINGAIELTTVGSESGSVRMNTTEVESDQSNEVATPISTSVPGSVEKIRIELNSQLSSKTLINSSSANVIFTLKELGDISFAVSEIYPNNGDLYLKIDDIKTPIDAYTNALNTVDKVGEAVTNNQETSGTTNNITDDQDLAMLSALGDELTNMFKGIAGQWLMIPLSEVNELATGVSQSEDASCATSLVNDFKNNTNQIAQLYRGNNFISSTTENVSITSKNSPVRRFVFNDEKLNNFADQLNNSEAVLNYKKCSNDDSDAIQRFTTQDMPAIYAEVDNNFNFTRFYTEIFLEDQNMNMTVDIDLSYPDSINVAEPEEYINLMDGINGLLTAPTNGNTDDGEVIEVVEEEPAKVTE